MREPGAGGGEDDLNRQYEIEFQDHSEVVELVELIGECGEHAHQKHTDLAPSASKYNDQPELRMGIIKLVKDELSSRGAVSLEVIDVYPGHESDAMSQEPLDMDDLSLENLVTALANRVIRTKKESESPDELPKQGGNLPQHILFPYSRHSVSIEGREGV